MNRRGLPALALLLIWPLLYSCATTPPVKPVATTDAEPLINLLKKRDALLAGGLTATLKLDYKGKVQRNGSRIFLALIPPASFRLEVPGVMGSTILVATGDGTSVHAYFPRDNRLFVTGARDSAFADLLPVPVPFEPYRLPRLLSGALGTLAGDAPTTALTMSDGTTVLSLKDAEGNLMIYRFSSGLTGISSTVGSGSYNLALAPRWPHYPVKVTYRDDHISLVGTFSNVKAMAHPGVDILSISFPSDAEVVDLEGSR